VFVRSLLLANPVHLLTLLRRLGCGFVDVGGRKTKKRAGSKQGKKGIYDISKSYV